MDEERILDLLVQWDDLRLQGRDISPEELCGECPELLNEVRIRVKGLKATEWMNKQGGEPTLVPKPTFLPNMNLGKFRLESLIGDGGFGQVWKAFDPILRRDVAIKIPHTESMASFDQFIEEACKVARLPGHPGIVQVYDAGKDGDVCYIVSSFIDGCTLAERIDLKPTEVSTALEWVAQIADALHYIHTEGIIHRDIKPSNILLGKDDKPCITDFGIALDADESLEVRTDTHGTLAFMSPERLAGEPTDRRTDIYSLGVVFYQLLTGTLPYKGNSPFDVQNAILEGRPTPPSQFNDQIPPQVERLCLKAMARRSDDRYFTAKAFADDVRVYVDPKERWRTYRL